MESLRSFVREHVGTDTGMLMLIAMWTSYYYFSSVFAGIYNKNLVYEDGVSSQVLTAMHLVVSVVTDGLFVHYVPVPSSEGPDHGRRTKRGAVETIQIFAPIAVFVVLGKLATYLSYSYVSMSLAHTAKASEPIFNVILSALLFHEWRSIPVYLSLLPIAAGVALASTTEMTYNTTGFVLAALSAMMKVLQNIYTKRVMNQEHYNFFEIHFWCGLASLTVMAPLIITQLILYSGGLGSFPVFKLLVCSFLQYASSVSSYMVLSLLSHLTFTITNTMKRLVIIVSGIIYFKQGFHLTNMIGVILAVSGVFIYNIAKDARVNVEAVAKGDIAKHPEKESPALKPYVDDDESLEEGGLETPGVHHVGFRQDIEATDSVRAKHDPTYASDIPKTESFG